MLISVLGSGQTTRHTNRKHVTWTNLRSCMEPRKDATKVEMVATCKARLVYDTRTTGVGMLGRVIAALKRLFTHHEQFVGGRMLVER